MKRDDHFFLDSNMSTVTVEVYSEKAIVVRNALEHHGPILQGMNGMFNDRLKGGRGWIFPKYMLSQIRGVVEKLNSGQYGNEFEQKVDKSADTVSKQEYLSLLSRVERLEALLSRTSGASVSGASVVDTSASASSSSWIQSEKPSEKPARVVLDEDDSPMVELEFEDEEKKQLTKPVRVVENGRQSFSKPKKV
jgi:hypothetical protein